MDRVLHYWLMILHVLNIVENWSPKEAHQSPWLPCLWQKCSYSCEGRGSLLNWNSKKLFDFLTNYLKEEIPNGRSRKLFNPTPLLRFNHYLLTCFMISIDIILWWRNIFSFSNNFTALSVFDFPIFSSIACLTTIYHWEEGLMTTYSPWKSVNCYYYHTPVLLS